MKIFHVGAWAFIVGMLLGIVASYVLLFEDLKALNPPKGGASDGKG